MRPNSGAHAQVFGLYARYNQWLNDKLFDIMLDLPADCELLPATGAILRQLNHVLVMDLVWLHRFKSALDEAGEPEAFLDGLMPEPHAMGQILFWRFQDMRQSRADTDLVINRLAANLTHERCEMPVTFRTLAEGETVTRPLWALLLHFFNHQSLHRGEIIGLLGASKIDIGATDILPLIDASSTPTAELPR